jgi:hypothetical protein
MIRHILMWKLDDSYTAEEKKKFIEKFSSRLLALNGKIEQLKSISVHENAAQAPSANYDMLLDTSFNSIEDLKSYAVHPEHVEVVEWSKPYKKERSCVDYEY